MSADHSAFQKMMLLACFLLFWGAFAHGQPAGSAESDLALGQLTPLHRLRVQDLTHVKSATSCLVTAGRAGVMIWDGNTGRLVKRISLPTEPYLASLDVSSDAMLLGGGMSDGTALLWDLPSGQAVGSLAGHGGVVSRIAFSSDGQTVLTFGSLDRALKSWGVTERNPIAASRGFSEGSECLAFSSDGKKCLMGEATGMARLCQTDSGRPLLALDGHKEAVVCGSLSADGTRALTGSADATARVWDLSKGDESMTLCGHSGAVVACSFSPDGDLVLTGGKDKIAKLWDAATGRQILELRGHTETLLHVGFTLDSSRAVTAGMEGVVLVWDISKVSR
ncbi:MAG TPA: WD40 repeat domain-containing protein [bacterium]|nr:WD40 repeat domain-containing protein [bacterium]